MRDRARRRRPGPPSSHAPWSRQASIFRSISSPSSKTRHLPRCIRPESSSSPTTTPPARSMTRHRRSARAGACRPTRFPTTRGPAPNAATTSSTGARRNMPASGRALTREQVADEFLLMGLRLAEGIDPARYARLAGRPLDPRRIALLREQGALETTAIGMLRLTLAGFPVLDAVVADLAA